MLYNAVNLLLQPYSISILENFMSLSMNWHGSMVKDSLLANGMQSCCVLFNDDYV